MLIYGHGNRANDAFAFLLSVMPDFSPIAMTQIIDTITWSTYGDK